MKYIIDGVEVYTKTKPKMPNWVIVAGLLFSLFGAMYLETVFMGL